MALLVVLLVIALLTIVVLEFTYSAQVETHFALSTRNALQAYYLARTGVNVAEAMIVGLPDQQERWMAPMPPLPVGDGEVVLRVRDETRLLNLNGILASGHVQPDRVDVFRRLFEILGIDRAVLHAIVDWVDGDDDPQVSPAGAEKSYYLGLTPPIWIRNAPLITLRELLQVRGVTPSVLARLEDFVTVLMPQKDGNPFKVNINTAPAEVLYALTDRLAADPGVVDRLIAMRQEHPFTSPSEFKAVSGFPEATNNDYSLLATRTDLFRIEAVGSVAGTTRGIVTVVRRAGRRITRLTWAPSVSSLALTSQPPSDFLATLAPTGGN